MFLDKPDIGGWQQQPFFQTLRYQGRERVEYDGLWYFIKLKKKSKPLQAN
jgi:hypothetical protein